MTANRNGTARRAALRVVAVAGFAAAAWFLGGAAAHADAPPPGQTAHAQQAQQDQQAQQAQQVQPAQSAGLLGSLLPPDLASAVGLRPVVEHLDTVLIGQTSPGQAPEGQATQEGQTPPQPDPRPGLLLTVTRPLLDTVQALVHPITTVVAPLAPPVVKAAEPVAHTVAHEVVAPATHAIDAVAGPALTALPVGVRPLPHLSPVRESRVREQQPSESAGPVDNPYLAPVKRDDPRRTPLMVDCLNGTAPAGGESRGGGAPAAVLGASSVLIMPLARALRRAMDSALRRAEEPRPTSSPD